MNIESLQVPSGVYYHGLDFRLLTLMSEHRFVEHRDTPFILKSKVPSHVYVFGRGDMTFNPELEWNVGTKTARLIQEETMPEDDKVCLVGIPTAGTTFAQAASMVSYAEKIWANGFPMAHMLMKEVPKDHGGHKGWFNDKGGKGIDPSYTYWRLDNVATNGASKLEAELKFEADDYPTVKTNPLMTPVFIWIDRQQGAIARLRAAGYTRIVVAYQLLDITYAYGELGLWPKSAIKAVEEEIRAHQFLPQTPAA